MGRYWRKLALSVAMAGALPLASLAEKVEITAAADCTVPTVDPGRQGVVEYDDVDWCPGCAPYAYNRFTGGPAGAGMRTTDVFADIVVPANCGPHGCPLDIEIHGGGWVNYDGPSDAVTTLATPARLPSGSLTLRSTAGLAPSGSLLVGPPVAGRDVTVSYAGISGQTLTGVHGGKGAFAAGTPVNPTCADARLADLSQCVLRREARIRAANFGIATAVVEYPLQQGPTYQNTISDQIATLLCSVRWLNSVSEAGDGSLAIDPTRVMVSGYSAGGQLASLLGTIAGTNPIADPSQYDLAACPYNATRIYPMVAVAAFYGFYHLEREPTGSIVARALYVRDPGAPGVTPSSATPPATMWAADRPRVAKYSPWSQLNRASPPILLLHGKVDEISPLWESEDMMTRATQLGVPALFIDAPAIHHGWFPFEHRDPRLEASVCTLMQFYTDRLKPGY